MLLTNFLAAIYRRHYGEDSAARGDFR